MPANLPPALVKGLEEIAALTPSEFDDFLSYLRQIPAEIRQHRVFDTGEFTIERLNDKGQSIKEAAFSLLLSRAARRIRISEFVDEVFDAISSLIDRDILRNRVVAILGIESLDLVARAHDVLLEHQQTFSSARTISDIRSIFGDEVSAGPVAAVLVHMLSIVYYSAGERHNFVLALDEKDIDHLADVLQRAKEKAIALKRTIEASQIPYIKVV
jgi:hypothetical protein